MFLQSRFTYFNSKMQFIFGFQKILKKKKNVKKNEFFMFDCTIKNIKKNQI